MPVTQTALHGLLWLGISLFVAGSLWAEQYLSGSSFLVPGVTAAAVAGWVLWSACQGRIWALQIYTVTAVFITGLSFRERAFDDASLDIQVLMKLGIYAGMMLIGLANLPWSARTIRTVPGMCLLAYILLAVVSSAWSPNPSFSFGAAVSVLAFFLYAATLVERFTVRPLVLTLLIGLSSHLALALVLVALNLDIGYWHGWSGNSPLTRLQGLTGHPFALAGYAAMVMVISWALWRDNRLAGRHLALFLALAGPILIMAEVRTAIAAVLVTMVAMSIRNRALGVPLLAIGLFAALFTLAAFPSLFQVLAGSVSRTGDISEVLALAGRTTIWKFSLQLFADRPFLGYGYGATRSLISENLIIGIEGTAVHAHNIIIQSLATMGLVGTSLLVVILGWQVAFFFKQPKSTANAIFVFVILLSVMSIGPLGMAPAQETLHWIVAVLISGAKMHAATQQARSQASGAIRHGLELAPVASSSLQEQLYRRRWNLLGGQLESPVTADQPVKPNASGRRWGLLGPQAFNPG